MNGLVLCRWWRKYDSIESWSVVVKMRHLRLHFCFYFSESVASYCRISGPTKLHSFQEAFESIMLSLLFLHDFFY